MMKFILIIALLTSSILAYANSTDDFEEARDFVIAKSQQISMEKPVVWIMVWTILRKPLSLQPQFATLIHQLDLHLIISAPQPVE